MRATSFLSIGLSIILLTFSSCKKNNTANCGNNVVCALLNGNTFSGDTYSTTSGSQPWQMGSYAILNKANGQLTIIGGQGATSTWVTLNISTSVKQDSTYSVTSGSLAADYYTPNPNNVPILPIYQWQDSGSLGTGTLTITLLDSVNNKVSGTFTGLVLEANNGQTPQAETFTNGYFTNLPLTY